MNAVFTANLAFAFAVYDDSPANVSPHLHVRVHPSLQPVPVSEQMGKCIRVLHFSSAFRFTFEPAFIYIQNFSESQKEMIFYAKIVRDGIISRKDAIKRVESENKYSIETIKELLEIAGIEYDVFMKALKKKSAHFST